MSVSELAINDKIRDMPSATDCKTCTPGALPAAPEARTVKAIHSSFGFSFHRQ